MSPRGRRSQERNGRRLRGGPGLVTYAGMPTDPAAVVQRQLNAYNARDLDALLAAYAPDAELYDHPATLLARGTAELQPRFAARFTEPNLHATLLHRLVCGNKVFDHERVTRTFPEGPGELEVVMVYEVAGDRIAKSWSVGAVKTVSQAGKP